MHGSVQKQVKSLFRTVDSVGTSKHQAKEVARFHGAKGWHEVGRQIGIHSHRTRDEYTRVWGELGQYMRSEFKIRDMQRITPEHVQSFLEGKIAAGVTYNSFTTYSSALQKLEVALDRLGEQYGNHDPGTYGFSNTIALMRAEARGVLERATETRAYEAPGKIIESLSGTFQLAASMQLESGARISEISTIHASQLNPDRNSVTVQGKGGKIRELQLSENTYMKLEEAIGAAHKETFSLSGSFYRSALQVAAKHSNQKYTGSHGLRWNFAQNRMAELTGGQGKPYEQALVQVSQEMGHERGSITEHYLQ
ncbi:integrase family protein [Desulfurispirillum indicum S5]|uniref:Integrase family protein n=1 Tax=Desulfurispirillum indicum (strain ATCC BAA-1389 / DSM 22839 / S5) TaxID=653733 RepID=E6W6T2_DESIS|nr:tyrosine-type recombinase/integrase [Desulfurispirillum indicum]ADU66175.1 integrase family protein [Desulfurispirillum indicum S5]